MLKYDLILVRNQHDNTSGTEPYRHLTEKHSDFVQNNDFQLQSQHVECDVSGRADNLRCFGTVQDFLINAQKYLKHFHLSQLYDLGPEKPIEEGIDSPIQRESKEEDINLQSGLAEFLKQWPISRPLTFKWLLQHWTVLTRQKNSHMTTLLMLLKHYQPVVNYDTLPCTGQKFVYTDGNDTKSIGLTTSLDSETDKIN